MNEELGPLMLDRLDQQVPAIEPLIPKDSEQGFAYAKGIGKRFWDGEVAIKTDAAL